MPLKGLRDELCTWTVCLHLSFDFPHFVSLHKTAVLYEQSYICSLKVPTSENPCDRHWLLRHWFSFLCCSESCQLLLIKHKPRQYSDTAGLTFVDKVETSQEGHARSFYFLVLLLSERFKKKKKKNSSYYFSKYYTKPRPLQANEDYKDPCEEPTWQPNIFSQRAGGPLDCGTIFSTQNSCEVIKRSQRSC